MLGSIGCAFVGGVAGIVAVSIRNDNLGKTIAKKEAMLKRKPFWKKHGPVSLKTPCW